MNKHFEKIKLMRARLPNLHTGTYQIKAEQTISSPVSKTLPPSLSTFHVNTRKFTLNHELIYSVYPQENTQGNYSGTLPHIILSAATFPWLRTLSSGDSAKPWLALISLSENEAYTLREQSIFEAVSHSEPDVFFPRYEFEENCGESKGDLCRTLELNTASLPDFLPREDELALLAHVRMVDLHDTADKIIPLDGCFSTLVCNRLPSSPVESPEKNTVFLISLEGYQSCLPEGARFGEVLRCSTARFLVLHSWSFYSEGCSEPGFRQLMRELDSGVLCVPPERASGEGTEILKRGYLPLSHILRTGERTVSFYHGPLIPCAQKASPRHECMTADGEIRYDPANGVFDMSYSAAWQLGRLIALSSQSIAGQIYQWRRAIKETVCRAREQSLWRQRANTLAGKKPKEEGAVRESVLSLAGELLPLITGENAFTPTADSTGLRGDFTGWMCDPQQVRAARAARKAGE